MFRDAPSRPQCSPAIGSVPLNKKNKSSPELIHYWHGTRDRFAKLQLRILKKRKTLNSFAKAQTIKVQTTTYTDLLPVGFQK